MLVRNVYILFQHFLRYRCLSFFFFFFSALRFVDEWSLTWKLLKGCKRTLLVHHSSLCVHWLFPSQKDFDSSKTIWSWCWWISIPILYYIRYFYFMCVYDHGDVVARDLFCFEDQILFQNKQNEEVGNGCVTSSEKHISAALTFSDIGPGVCVHLFAMMALDRRAKTHPINPNTACCSFQNSITSITVWMQ